MKIWYQNYRQKKVYNIPNTSAKRLLRSDYRYFRCTKPLKYHTVTLENVIGLSLSDSKQMRETLEILLNHFHRHNPAMPQFSFYKFFSSNVSFIFKTGSMIWFSYSTNFYFYASILVTIFLDRSFFIV